MTIDAVAVTVTIGGGGGVNNGDGGAAVDAGGVNGDIRGVGDGKSGDE